MFNETSYKTAWQGRDGFRGHPNLPTHMTSDTGGTDMAYAPGYAPLVESPGFRAPGRWRDRYPVQAPTQSVPVTPTTPTAPVDPNANAPTDTTGGFDLSSITSIFSGLSTIQLLMLAGAVYYFFLRKH